MGVPIAISMGLSAAVVIWCNDLPLAVIAQRTVNALDSVPLLAVPMFILAAALFGASGITKHLFELIRLLVGRVRGGLGHVTVLANLVFSGISGAALADIGALGGTQIRMMREQGYKDEFAAGITMAAATIGPIFPPSIPLIIFAAAAEVSAVKVLLAGALPALVIALMLMLQIAVMARRQNLPARHDRGRASVAGACVREGVARHCSRPVILIGGLVSGLFGPTEVAGVTVVYALFLGVFVYRELTWKGARRSGARDRALDGERALHRRLGRALRVGADHRPGADTRQRVPARAVEESVGTAAPRQLASCSWSA